MRPNTRVLGLLALGHLVVDMNQGALAPLLPFLKTAFGLSYAASGAILLVASMTSSVVQPVFGYLADRATRRWLLPWAVLLSAIGVALAGLAPSYWGLLALVVVSGLGVAAYHPEGYRTANQVAGDRKATGLSLFSIGGNIGIALGPPAVTFLVPRFGLPGTLGLLGPGLLVAALLATVLPALIARAGQGRDGAHGARGRPRHARGDGAPDRGRDRAVVDAARPGDLRALPLRRPPRQGSARRRAAPVPLPRGRRAWARSRAGRSPIAGGLAATSSRASSCRPRSSPSFSGGRAGWLAAVALAATGFVLVSSFSITVALGQAYLPRQPRAWPPGLIVGLAIGTGGSA